MSVVTATRLGALSLFLVVAGGAFGGCAGASQGARAPGDEEVTTLAEAESLLERSEDDLHAALVHGESKDASGADAGPPARPGYPTPYAERPRQSHEERRCTTACRALASMDRAAARLCTLAGGGDPRCHSARRRVDSARDLVRQSCPACTA